MRVEENPHSSIRLSLTYLKFMGFWAPRNLPENRKLFYYIYSCFMFMFMLGSFMLFQTVDMFLIWGDLPAMTGNAFILFTNLAQTIKIFNLMLRQDAIRTIIDQNSKDLKQASTEEEVAIVRRSDKETLYFQGTFSLLTAVTLAGWLTSPEAGNLPLRAWYPYDTSVPMLYRLTYAHQAVGIVVSAFCNVAKDILVVSLIAQVRCRLLLLRHSLLHIHAGLTSDTSDSSTQGTRLLSRAQEQTARSRLGSCVYRHQGALATAAELQRCFSEPTFAQFSVSLVIICVSAYQLAAQTRNPVRLVSMATYLLNMMFQIFMYCYQGTHLREVSVEVVQAAYESTWYRSSRPFLRGLTILMLRGLRPVSLTAARFTSLNIQTFMTILKTSYSFFTVLQQIKEE